MLQQLPAFAHLPMQILTFQNLKPLQLNSTLISFNFLVVPSLAAIKHRGLCWRLRNNTLL